MNILPESFVDSCRCCATAGGGVLVVNAIARIMSEESTAAVELPAPRTPSTAASAGAVHLAGAVVMTAASAKKAMEVRREKRP